MNAISFIQSTHLHNKNCWLLNDIYPLSRTDFSTLKLKKFDFIVFFMFIIVCNIVSFHFDRLCQTFMKFALTFPCIFLRKLYRHTTYQNNCSHLNVLFFSHVLTDMIKVKWLCLLKKYFKAFLIILKSTTLVAFQIQIGRM